MKVELEQPETLDRLRFDMFDAGRVEKVVFVVLYELPFHLIRSHSYIRLGYVDHRDIEIRKDILGHSKQRETRAKNKCEDYNNDRDRPAQSYSDHPHRTTNGPRSRCEFRSTVGRSRRRRAPVATFHARRSLSRPHYPRRPV